MMSSDSKSGFVDFYDLLGVLPTAEMHEIRRAYILKAKEHHPDAGGSIEYMQKLNIAYKTLKDVSSKAAYDMLHNFHDGSTSTGDYRYNDGREVRDVSDMKDDEIDAFLDSLLRETRGSQLKSKKNFKQWLRDLI